MAGPWGLAQSLEQRQEVWSCLGSKPGSLAGLVVVLYMLKALGPHALGGVSSLHAGSHLCIARALASTKGKCPRELNGATRTWQLVSTWIGYVGSTPGTQPWPLRNIYLFYAICSSSGEETQNVSPLAELPGLCSILLLEAFKSFLTKDECKAASSTVQPNSLVPWGKDSSSHTPPQPRFAVRRAQLLS